MAVTGWDEWACHDAAAATASVRTKPVTPPEPAGQAAEGIDRPDQKLPAVIGVLADMYVNPDLDGPAADGMPMFLMGPGLKGPGRKDPGPGLRGHRRSSGAGFTLGTMMSATDPTIERFLAAGPVPPERSATREFGVAFVTVTGCDDGPRITRNPRNQDRSAAGTMPPSISFDGGGSTRLPPLLGARAPVHVSPRN
jgi:hypothetical protein